MIEGILGTVRGVAEGWRSEARRRRAITKTDPAADTLEHCASELESVVDQLDRDTLFLSTVEFAELHHVTPQTVRTWIRRKELPAATTADGDYRIRHDAKRTKRLVA